MGFGDWLGGRSVKEEREGTIGDGDQVSTSVSG